MNRQHVMIGFLIVALTLAAAPHPFAVRAAEPARPVGDFNGDRYDDLVIGVPYEAVGDETNAGAIHVLYGEANLGLEAAGNQQWYQGRNNAEGSSEAYDEFGFALAIADFDGDSFLDLAVGVHGETIGGVANAGVVQVFYGTATGLSGDRDELWHQDVEGIEDEAETDDRFGWSLTAGDFNGDGYGDLAVGVLWEDVEDSANPGSIVENAGAVNVIYGSEDGLTATGNQVWHRDNLIGALAADDDFGHALGAGDFDGDGYDDLVVGTPHDDVDQATDCGTVNIIYGSDTGLTNSRQEMWYQDSDSILDEAETGDHFGFAVVTGDANGDGYDDLAVSAPYEDLDDPVAENAGVVHIIQGSASGLTGHGDLLLHQSRPDVNADEAEAHDNFGYSLAGGDFDGNGYIDLAVGVPYEDVGDPAVSDAGAVHVFYIEGPAAFEDELWDQARIGGYEMAEVKDHYGWSLAAGDFDGNGYADLAIGVPHEDIGDPVIEDAGGVNVLYGHAYGLGQAPSEWWTQDSDEIVGSPEANDRFGSVLAAIPTVRHKIYLPIVQRND